MRYKEIVKEVNTIDGLSLHGIIHKRIIVEIGYEFF